MSQQKYFKEDHLRVKELRDQGKNLKQIATLLEMSRSTVSWLARHGQNLKMRNPVQVVVESGPAVIPEEEPYLFEHDSYYTLSNK